MSVESPDFSSALKARHPRAFAALLLVVLFLIPWFNSGYTVLSKHAFATSVNPLIFSLARDVCATPLLFIYTALCDGWPAVEWALVPRLVVLGAVGIFAAQLFYALGIQQTTGAIGSIMNLLIPVFTSTLAVLLGLERAHLNEWFGWARVIGLVAAVGGAAYILLASMSTGALDSSAYVTGALCFVASTLASSVYLIVQRALVLTMPPSRVVFWAYFFGMCALALSSLYYVDDASVWHIGSDAALGALAYAALVNSCAMYVAVAWANRWSSPLQIAACIPLQVPATVVLSRLLLGESDWRSSDALGCACVVLGLGAVTLAQHRAAQARAADEAAASVCNDVSARGCTATSVASASELETGASALSNTPLLAARGLVNTYGQ